MPGRQQEPSFQLASGTTAERDNSYNIGTVGNIFYNTDTSNVEIRHVDPTNSLDWRDLVVNNKEQIDLSGEIVVKNSLRLPTGTTAERNAHSNIGNIFYNTDTSNVEIRHVDPSNSLDWRDLVVNNRQVIDVSGNVIINGNVLANEKLRIELYTDNGVVQTIATSANFVYLNLFHHARVIRGDPNTIQFFQNGGYYLSKIKNNSPYRKRFFFRLFLGHVTGGMYVDVVAFSNDTTTEPSGSYSSGDQLIRHQGGIRNRIGNLGHPTAGSLNINQLHYGAQYNVAHTGPADRQAYTGILDVESQHFIHILFNKDDSGDADVGLSSNARADCYPLLYLYEL